MDRFMSSRPNVFLTGYPLPLRIHAGLLLGLGLGLTFAPSLVIENPMFRAFERFLGVRPYHLSLASPSTSTVTGSEKPRVSTTSADPSLPTPASVTATRRTLTTTGLLAFGLGLSYVGTASLPGVTPQNNQLVYGAVPLRLLMVAAAAVNWVVDKEARDAFKVVVMVEDLLGSMWLVWTMRDWMGWSAYA